VDKPAVELRGARTKLLRADEHLGELRVHHERFVSERNPYRMLREFDAERGYHIWRAKIEEAPPLEKWASLAGECVHALRGALDHTAYELVRINRPNADYSEFPIFKDKDLWIKNGPGKLPGVDRKVLAQAKWLQPYRRAQRFDPLWIIHFLDVIDKHRRLNLVSPLMRRAIFDSVPEDGITDAVVLAGRFIDGTPIARFKTKPDVQVKTHFVFDIAFGEGELRQGEPVMETLNGLCAYAGFVVARFDRLFA
jgi:hypothetical protein